MDTPTGQGPERAQHHIGFTSEPVTSKLSHPLDFLNEQEIKISVELIRAFFKNEPTLRFCRLFLKEPEKDYIQNFDSSTTKEVQRDAFGIVFERASQRTFEVTIALTLKGSERLVSCIHIPGVQPCLLSNEYEECESAVRADPRVLEIMKKKGITDINKVAVDLWVGFYDEPTSRIAKPLLFYRENEDSNIYSKPIDGVEISVDLSSMKVVDVREIFDVPVPPPDPIVEYIQRTKFRPDLRPINIIQPDGVSFKIEGKKVSWQNWSFRVGYTTWEGLVLRQIRYNDNGKERPIMYRASVAEMVVPYGDNKFPNTIKNAFDAAEDGLGSNCHSLEYGCDCIGAINYFDVAKVDALGNITVIKNAICLHEEDVGILWKHKEWRTDHTETRRSRRLVISFFTTIANYDYGFYWYFYQDGSIKLEAKLTGILSVTAIKTGQPTGGFGTIVGPNVYGPIHQHLFTARLDMEVDGRQNSVQEVNVFSAEPDKNPYKQSFFSTITTFNTEREAMRNVYPYSGRYWRIVNPSKRNRNGELCGWKIVAGPVSFPLQYPESLLMKRAGYLKHNIWVTPYHTGEFHPAGNYPTQRMVEDGLSKWAQANRSINNVDLVVWFTFGIMHVTRTEDWPIMPVEYCGFEIKPENFFDYNPSMDVPPSANLRGELCHSAVARSKL